MGLPSLEYAFFKPSAEPIASQGTGLLVFTSLPRPLVVLGSLFNLTVFVCCKDDGVEFPGLWDPFQLEYSEYAWISLELCAHEVHGQGSRSWELTFPQWVSECQ